MLEQLAKIIRYYILVATTQAGSGHPSSSLSAVELMTTLFFDKILKCDLDNFANPENDRVIFSKGHASPLLYALYAAAGKLTLEEMKKMRTFNSPLEGHPTPEFKFTEIATGSLGQGLAVGIGMALNAQQFEKNNSRVYVLLGDGEMAEGSNWESMQLAAYYHLHNLVGIIDVNRLGQRGPTMQGYDLQDYARKAEAFGWQSLTIDGHNYDQISQAFTTAQQSTQKPTMIIAKTIKGKGVSFMEDQENWHGRTLTPEQLQQALTELGKVDLSITGQISPPEMETQPKPAATVRPSQTERLQPQQPKSQPLTLQPIATRKAAGDALTNLGTTHPNLVVLDAEVGNSTYTNTFQAAFPNRFLEMFIAEQSMVGTALGLAKRGKIPFVTTFGAFLTRAYDFIRMVQYSNVHVNFIGSHAGVSIGEDGASQMALEDLSMFRSLFNSTVLYPCDQVATHQLTANMIPQPGICYLRTTREDTPNIYQPEEKFAIGGSKTLKQSSNDQVTIVAAGITVYQALQAHQLLLAKNINARVIDAYSIKPIDQQTLLKAAQETPLLLTVEDHVAQGGLADAVREALAQSDLENCPKVHSLAVTKIPHSAQPEELRSFEEIDATAIVKYYEKLSAR